MSAGAAEMAPAELAVTVRCSGVTLGYRGRVVLAVDDFELGRGERVSLLGPNGGGKTTLLRGLSGELAPLTGEIWTARAAVVPQSDRSRIDFPVSALDVALMGSLTRLPWWRRPGRAERIAAREALARVGLAERARETFGSLSGGQRQRVLLARALVQDAPLLLLDEPFAGVDAASRDVLLAIFDELAQAGRTLVIATHEASDAKRWDRTLVAEGGRLRAEDPHAHSSDELHLGHAH